MRLLVVLPEPPVLEGGAIGKCAVATLRGLMGHGLDVRALAARRGSAHDRSPPPPDLPVEVVDVAYDEPGWRDRLRFYVTRPCGELGRGAFKSRVDACAAAADVVHLEEVQTGWCDLGLTLPSCATIHYRARLDRGFGRPWSRQCREVLAVSMAERAVRRRHRWVVASSPVVAASLRAAHPRAEVVLAPLGLDPADYPLAPLDGPPVAGVIGTGSWAPTAQAMHRLTRRVWPEVRRLVPDARLLVAGRGTQRLGLPTGDGVEVLGAVASSAEFLRGLSVLVYPLERGSGVKVKVIEAMACGLPVVTTQAGAEGVEAGEGVTVEADDRNLAEATAGDLLDAGARRQRGALARATLEAYHSPLPSTAPLIDLYRRMVN